MDRIKVRLAKTGTGTFDCYNTKQEKVLTLAEGMTFTWLDDGEEDRGTIEIDRKGYYFTCACEQGCVTYLYNGMEGYLDSAAI